MKALRKHLVRNSDFYPFSDKFDRTKLLDLINQFIAEQSDEHTDDINTAYVAILINSAFADTFKFLQKELEDSNLTVDNIFNYCMSSINRDLMYVQNIYKKSFLSKDEHHFQDSFKFTIKSIDPSIGNISAQGAMETSVDALNILFNFVNYFNQRERSFSTNTNLDIDNIIIIKSLVLSSTFYYVLKSAYDGCLWNQGFAIVNNKRKTITFKYSNKENLLLKKAGYIRLHNNIRSTHQFMIQALNEDENNELFKWYNELNKKKKRIKEIDIKAGSILYKLGDGISKDEVFEELINESEFITYYNFIEDINLPNLDKLSLRDVLRMFNVLQHLFRGATRYEIKEYDVKKLTDYNKFPFRIKYNELKKYLSLRTKYTSKQISQFLDLLNNKPNKRINFWSYPLYKMGEYFIFPLISIAYPITLVLSDIWLEDGGFNLNGRGAYLEKYLKKSLEQKLKSKNYEFYIPKVSKFGFQKSKSEEIDLIINLKTVLIVAEIKCIKFSMCNPPFFSTGFKVNISHLIIS